MTGSGLVITVRFVVVNLVWIGYIALVNLKFVLIKRKVEEKKQSSITQLPDGQVC